MFKKLSGSSVILALLVSGAAAAQAPGAPVSGTVEFGAFGQWTWFDANAGRTDVVPEDGFGYGGRLGLFLTPRFQVEADGWYSPQDRSEDESFCCTGARSTEVNASAFAARLNYNHPFGSILGAPSQFVLGVGAVRTSYDFAGGTTDAEDVSSYGATGLAGLRIGVVNRVSVRLDGVVDHMPNHEPSANTNVHARAGLSLLLGAARQPAIAAAPPAPGPRPSPAAPAVPAPPAVQVEEAIRVCVVEGNRLTEVAAIYIPARRDTVVLVDGQRRAFASVYPATAPGYAESASGTITVSGQEYVSFGLPRVIPAAQLTRVGESDGVGLFAETGAQAPHGTLYLPLRPGCQFQPYQLREAIRVRG